ncbi:aminoglycoside phosphotransferase family protein [Isoptericola croceus]|uniref:aminoglycoside phosphotransferase family protein n=1 Tax=Isoptericola croceus TaxID=3031406 RepID=UPI0023FA4809|nr:aminoglycoside phosphotransferase family protein [Isoptericola croceus]
MTTPTQARTRPVWPELPAHVRAALEGRLGGAVTAWTSHDGGYSPGLASTLWTPHGPVFVKAVAVEHELAATLYRQEAHRAALLPDGVPTPRLRWLHEVPASDADDAWVAVAFDAVPGRSPRSPWVPDELDAVMTLAGRVTEHEIAPGVLPEMADELPQGLARRLADERPDGLATYDPWLTENLDRLAEIETDAGAAVAGSSLAHGDLRGDNVVLTGAGGTLRAVAVDWPYAVRGAAFCDVVGMLPSIRLEGGPAPWEALGRHPLPVGTDEDAVRAYLVALTGYFVHASLQPPPRGIPHVRAFQRAQAAVCIDWLRRPRLSV